MFKWVRWALSALLFVIGIGAFVQWPFKVPSGLDALHDLAFDAELWLVNHVELPALFTLFMMIGVLLLFPDLMRVINALQGLPHLHVTGPYLYRDDIINHHRVVIENHGGNPAENVEVQLVDVVPRPRAQRWKADYPYRVQRVGATGSDQAPCRIGPGMHERFEVISGWPNKEGLMFAGGLSTKGEYRDPLNIQDDERWTLTYEVTADNAELRRFALTAHVEKKTLIVERTEPTVSTTKVSAREV
jgi:hypothetical protein